MDNKKITRCKCGKVLFNGEIGKFRILKVADDNSVTAKCSFCKRWQKVPFIFKGLAV